MAASEITISADEGIVAIRCQSAYPISKCIFPFTYNAGCDWQAALLAAHLREHMHNTMKTIRKEAYELGYKDGRAKRAKKRYFWCGFGLGQRDIW